MEIRDYVGTLRRRWWILVLPPLVAGAAVLAMAASTPAEFRATATVAAPSLIGTTGTAYGGPNGTKAFVADFSAIVKSDRILQKVATATGVPAGRIADGLTVRQVGTSTLMQVTFRTDRTVDAPRVAAAAAGEAMKFLPSSQVDLAGSLVEQAQKTADDAEVALDDFAKASGVVVPDRDYQIKAQQVSDLERQSLEAAARGNTDEAARIAAALPAKRAEVAALAPKLAAYNALVDRRDRARDQLAEAQGALGLALAVEKASDPASVVTVGPTREISRADAAVRKAVVAVGASLFLAIGLVALLEPAGRRHLRLSPVVPRPVAGMAPGAIADDGSVYAVVGEPDFDGDDRRPVRSGQPVRS
jgi:hypothetical protein